MKVIERQKKEQENEDREYALQLQDAFNEGRPKRRAAAKAAPSKKKAKRSTKAKEEEGEEGEDGEAAKKPKKTRPKKVVSLSPALSEFMGVAYSQRGEVVKKIWQHIKANDLQDPKDKRNILLDTTLKRIFGENRKAVNMFKMNKFLSNQMKPPELLA